jgi:hypothetical protein
MFGCQQAGIERRPVAEPAMRAKNARIVRDAALVERRAM